jgi:hypothetical protein
VAEAPVRYTNSFLKPIRCIMDAVLKPEMSKRTHPIESPDYRQRLLKMAVSKPPTNPPLTWNQITYQRDLDFGLRKDEPYMDEEQFRQLVRYCNNLV